MKGIKKIDSTQKSTDATLLCPEEQRDLLNQLPEPDMERKTCNKCHRNKPVSDFTKDSKSPDGFCRICKECRKRYAVISEYRMGMARKKQSHPMEVTSKRCGKCNKTFPIDHFHKNKLQKDGHSSVCKDCQKQYERLLRERNRARAQQLNVGDKPVSKRCSWCHRTLLISEFSKNSSKPDGHTDICSDCRRSKQRIRYTERAKKYSDFVASGLMPKTKICTKCKQELPIDSFAKSASNIKDGHANYCKSCRKAYEKERIANFTAYHKKFGIDTLTTKHCNFCDRDLPASCFQKHSCKPDGLASECKECRSKRRRGAIDK